MAHGLTVTGAVDWYIGKALGTPKTPAGAQLRLLIPVTIVSGFLNNTPIVALMIPIVLRWARTIRISASQLLIPLSYGAIIGGTMTLIGTSTNLVVAGLLEGEYPNEVISLFDITPYGVPAAFIGIAYIIVFGPILLPGAQSGDGGSPLDGDEILLGARITSWSPAAGRSVKRSGLRDTGGLYLVSVRRAATGNIHRAVGQEFVLDVGDVVYFSGLIEGFGDFCNQHGLEIVTNESSSLDNKEATTEAKSATNDDAPMTPLMTPTVDNAHVGFNDGQIGFTKESLALSDEAERLRSINLMTGTYQLGVCCHSSSPQLNRFLRCFISDIIHGLSPVESSMLQIDKPAQIIIASDGRSSHRLVLIGVNTPDRPGLLLDISKGLLRLNLQVHRTEAVVLGEHSSIIY